MIALVTGASSGIGRDIAKELAKRKYDIIAVARNINALEQLKTEIEKQYKVKVYIKIVDLSNRNKCIELYESVKQEHQNIDVLVNNAGFGDCGRFEETNLDKDLSMIDTNIVALHILTKLFLKDMCKANKGHILNVASIAGFMPGPLMATYYSTKAYVVRLTQSIRQELFMKHSRVKISALCPGPVNTNFNKVANVRFNLIGQNSKYVAKYAVHKMFMNKILIFPSLIIWTGRLIFKILPDQISAFLCYFAQRKKIQ